MSFRDEIKKHADQHWFQACADGVVWVSYKAISIRQSILDHKLPAGQFTSAFLDYPSRKKPRAEGLFLIKNSEQPAALKTWNVESCPSAIMLASFFNHRSDDPDFPASKRPKDFGLNDCTHFTSECVVAGGMPTSLLSIDAGQFFNALYASSKTKTLARVVPIEDARKIIEAPQSPFKVGDVIIYSGGPTDHHHGVVHLGGGTIAMHTVSLHLKHPTAGPFAFWDMLSRDEHHNKVTLYHFNIDDTAPTASLWLPGWWRVTQGLDTWHYFFDSKGRVMYTDRAPSSLTAPPGSPDGKGYWFENSNFLSLCWTRSGTFERFTFQLGPSLTRMKGSSNGLPGLVATKL